MSGEQYMKDECWLDLRRSFDIDPEKGYIVDWCGELTVWSRILVRRKWDQYLRASSIEDNKSREEDFGGPQDSFQTEPISQSTSLGPPQETDKPDRVIKASKDWSIPSRSTSLSHPDPRDFLPRHISKSLLPAYTSESTRPERASIAPDQAETEQHYRHDGKAFPVSSDGAAQQIQALTELLGHPHKTRDAIDAYTQACESLQWVIEESKDVEERERLQDLMSSYEKRIVELQRLDLDEVLAGGQRSKPGSANRQPAATSPARFFGDSERTPVIVCW
jgi:hypothetical protein